MSDAPVISMPAAEKALLDSEYGFGEDVILTIADAETDRGSVQNWSRAVFDEVLGPLHGRAAFEVIRRLKVGDAESAEKKAVIPLRAPYLVYGRDGKPEDYDPRDPSQFYTDPETGEMYRWDGTGRVRRCTVVGHKRFGDTLLPNEEEASAAIEAGLDWFHRGLNVWIGYGGKQLAEATQEDRDAVRVAMLARERRYENDGSRPFVGRPIPAMVG